MPGPIDLSDPSVASALFPGVFAAPPTAGAPDAGAALGAPPALPGAGPLSIPGVGALPPGIAARFAGPVAPSVPPAAPVSPPGVPSPMSIMGMPLPPSIAQRFAPGPMGAPPIAAPPVPTAMRPIAIGKRANDPTAIAEDAQQQGIAERRAAAVQSGQALSDQGSQESDLWKGAQRDSDAIRAQQAAQLQKDMADQQRMRADLEQASKQYADSKIDQGRWFHSLSTGKTVLMGIGLALGDLGAALNRTGPNAGKNPALDMIMDAVHQDVQLQMADREHLGTVVGQKGAALDRMMSLTRDNQAAYQTAIAGALDRVKTQVQQIAAQTQSSTAKANALDLVGQLDTASGQALDAATQQALQNKRQQQQIAIQGGELALAQRKDKREADQQSLQNAWTTSDRALNAALLPGQLAAQGQKQQLDTAKEVAGIQKDQAETAAAMTKAAEGGTSNGTFVAPVSIQRDPTTGEKSLVTAPMKQADGTPFVAEKDERKDLRKEYGAALKYATFADQLVDLRNQYGSEAFKTTGAREMKAKFAQLVSANKDLMGVNRYSDATADLITKAIGTDDPTEFRGVIDSIISSRKDALTGLNADFRAAGYTGKPIDIPSVGLAPPSNTPGQAALESSAERAKAFQIVTPDDANATLAGDDRLKPLAQKLGIPSDVLARSARAGDRPPTPGAIKGAYQAIELARRGDESGIDAVAQLVNSDNAGLRYLARDAVEKFGLPVKNDWSVVPKGGAR